MNDRMSSPFRKSGGGINSERGAGTQASVAKMAKGHLRGPLQLHFR
jgi:hypothetical protein